jgi:hypothetical protein
MAIAMEHLGRVASARHLGNAGAMPINSPNSRIYCLVRTVHPNHQASAHTRGGQELLIHTHERCGIQ